MSTKTKKKIDMGAVGLIQAVEPTPKEEESELSQLLGLVKDMSSKMTGLDERIKNRKNTKELRVPCR